MRIRNITNGIRQLIGLSALTIAVGIFGALGLQAYEMTSAAQYRVEHVSPEMDRAVKAELAPKICRDYANASSWERIIDPDNWNMEWCEDYLHLVPTKKNT